MSNKPKRSKTNITKISAKPNDGNPNNSAKSNDQLENHPTTPTPSKPAPAKHSTEKPLKETFILARPFVAFGRYLRDSWREIRQVRWPGRKLTWKMTLAVLIYCSIFIAFIVLLDTFFTFIFNLLINAK